jgi:hypothetical protein
MVVIVWLLDLQLPMYSVPITTKVVSSNHADGKVYSVQHLCDKVYECLLHSDSTFFGNVSIETGFLIYSRMYSGMYSYIVL